MSRYNKLFNHVPIDVPNRSGFDMSHDCHGTLTCGTLVPVLVDELLPQDTISLGHLTNMEFPPFATNFRGRVDVHLEAFFVPNRILYGGWESLITHPTLYPIYPEGTDAQTKSKYLPGITVSPPGDTGPSAIPPAELINRWFGPGSLADWLGYKCYKVAKDPVTPVGIAIPNALPWLAYHKIYNDHYRYSKIMPELFYRPGTTAPIRTSPVPSVGRIFTSPSVVPYSSDNGLGKVWIRASKYPDDDPYSVFPDGHSILDLRQRTWFRDYYTTASPEPQAGQAASVSFDIVNNKGSFTIAELRSQNSLQMWLERQNICGYDYASQIKGNFGKYPSSTAFNKALYLGRSVFNMYCKGVSQTSGGQGAVTNSNPFTSVGTRYGQGMSLESSSLVDSFTADEHGLLMVMMSIVPHASYGSGKDRYLFRSTMSDFAFPLLQGVGEQAILSRELLGLIGYDDSETDEFGYCDLYSEYKFKNDRIHGLLRDGSPLDSFALQRGFNNLDISISTDFLLIPKGYLDQVKAVSTEVSGVDSWFSTSWMYKKVSTLAPYSVPTLENPKNTHKTSMPRGGNHL
nr:MAG: major capsid protein [Microviridae sp.]